MAYEPTTQRAKRSRYRVVIDGRDVTHFRDAEIVVEGYELTEPYGYGPATITLPTVTFLEEHLFGTGELAFVRKGAHVRIDKVGPNGGVLERGRYRGRVASLRTRNDGTTLECDGAASFPLSQRYRPQRVVRRVWDIGRHISGTFHEAGLRLPRIDTGIEIDNGSGGMTFLGWVDHCLAMWQDDDGNQGTVMPVEGGRNFELRLKDRTTVHATVWADAFGVEVDVVDDVREQPNAVYGDGVAPNGSMWLNARWPELGPEEVPAFPGPMSVGSTGAGVVTLRIELRSRGLLGLGETDDTYNDAMREAVLTVQEMAGLPETGEVDAATWRAVFGDDITDQSIRYARVHPLVIQSKVQKYLYTANGSVSGLNPGFDKDELRVDLPQSYGAGVHKAVARRDARRTMRRAGGKNYAGTITLTADVWAGDHTHGTAGTVMEKEDLKAGQNILVRKPGADILFHIASVRVARDGTVTLIIDTQARDYLHVGEILQRDEEARRDPSRNALNLHRNSTQVRDAMTGWYEEDGAGLLRQRVVCPGNQWTAFPVVGGQEGEVMRTTIETTNAPAAFVFAVAGVKFRAEALARRIPDPWAKDADGELAWSREDIQEWLHEENRFLYVIGDIDQPGGYWPRKHTGPQGNTTAHPVTGKHKDYMTWPYVTADGCLLWCAIFPDRDTVLEPQELFRGSRVLGS